MQTADPVVSGRMTRCLQNLSQPTRKLVCELGGMHI
jgi:hypothetical protein